MEKLSYLPNDLRNLNEICRRDVPYDSIKIHTKTFSVEDKFLEKS